jgi:hypothetical protein
MQKSLLGLHSRGCSLLVAGLHITGIIKEYQNKTAHKVRAMWQSKLYIFTNLYFMYINKFNLCVASQEFADILKALLHRQDLAQTAQCSIHVT